MDRAAGLLLSFGCVTHFRFQGYAQQQTAHVGLHCKRAAPLYARQKIGRRFMLKNMRIHEICGE